MLNEPYVIIGVGLLAGLALIPPALTLFAFLDWIKSRIAHGPRRRWLLRLAIAADLVAVLAAVDAWYIEPKMLTVTRISAESPKIAPDTGVLKIVHITDIHYETETPLLRKVLRAIRCEKPDLIVITGDVPQMGPYDPEGLKDYLREIASIAPTYAVPGFYEGVNPLLESAVGDHTLFNGTHDRLRIRGIRVIVQGFNASGRIWAEQPARTRKSLYLVLHHTPDGIPDAASLRPDWFFAGHTHGGQVRLPIWGAIITLSGTGKRYEYGRYKVGGMNVFVSRGIGLEPRPAPQVRFLCPPEIVVLTLRAGQ